MKTPEQKIEGGQIEQNEKKITADKLKQAWEEYDKISNYKWIDKIDFGELGEKTIDSLPDGWETEFKCMSPLGEVTIFLDLQKSIYKNDNTKTLTLYSLKINNEKYDFGYGGIWSSSLDGKKPIASIIRNSLGSEWKTVIEKNLPEEIFKVPEDWKKGEHSFRLEARDINFEEPLDENTIEINSTYEDALRQVNEIGYKLFEKDYGHIERTIQSGDIKRIIPVIGKDFNIPFEKK
jgi:hypothetical protein